MGAKIGVWIDHRKAVIVIISDKGEEIRQIESNVEKQHGRIGGIRSVTSYESQMVAASDIHEREFTGRLNVFYDEVLASIHDAEAILLLGPGEAKGELKKRLSKNNLGDRVADVYTVDKLTVPQIAAKVRGYFLKPAKKVRDDRRYHDHYRSGRILAWINRETETGVNRDG